MRLDSQSVADVVVLAVKSALQPVLERLAASDARAEALQAQVNTLSELRDRVVAAETKTALTVAPQIEPVTVDLSPVLERMAAAEARLEVLGDLRDRVVTVETKGAMPLPPAPTVDLAPVLERLTGLDARISHIAGQTELALTKECSALRERVAVIETRAPVAGPPGKDGADGKAGQNGVDGLGFEDLSVEFDGDRTLGLKFVRGDVTKVFNVPLPFQRYQGVYQEGKSYSLGDTVTWAGSTWHCQDATTTKPGEGSKAWLLVVKRGRDGKDGKDGAQGPAGRDLTKEAPWRS